MSESTVETKPIYRDKTLWTNISAIVGAVGAYFTGALDLAAALSTAVLAVLNIVLRVVGKQPATPSE